MPEQLRRQYERLKGIASGNHLSEPGVAQLISDMALHARQMLAQVKRVELVSRVAGKRYISFLGQEQSRPVNEALYAENDDEFGPLLEAFTGAFRRAEPSDIARATYTVAFSILAANDVYKVGRKASATFFEVLIGHIVACILGASPRKKVQMPEVRKDLPTDYVFDLGRGNPKVHLPVKISTRERAVQAWVHQLMLDRIFGNGSYLGVLVIGTETKRNARSGEVIEICVPKQWQLYQSRLAKITRVYYLDPPQDYLALASDSPRVEVGSFGQIVSELEELLRT